DARTNADLTDLAGDRFGQSLDRLIGVELEIEAVRIACFSKQTLGFRRIVVVWLIARRAGDHRIPADGGRHFRDPTARDDLLLHQLAVDRHDEGLADTFVHHDLVLGTAERI